MRTRCRHRQVALLLALVAVVAAALGATAQSSRARTPAIQAQTPTPQETATIPTTPSARLYWPLILKQRAGRWAGWTSDGTPIIFYLNREGTAIEDLLLGHMAHCPWTSTSPRTTYLPGPIPVVNGSFVFEWDEGVISGHLVSGDQAEGSWGMYWEWANYHDWPCRSAGNWTAAKDAELEPRPTPTPWPYPFPHEE